MHEWRLGSLFAGIGGLELGFERTGRFRTVWQVEADPFARSILETRWPTCRRAADVRLFDGAPADIIIGGFPCQDISTAGKRAGIEGARSGLWSEFARIIGRVRPRVVVVENVAALLHRGADRVLGDLAACGYDAWWDCIPAAAVGAPHRRDRVFLVAHAHGHPLREEPFPVPWSELAAFAARNGGSGPVADAGRDGRASGDELLLHQGEPDSYGSRVGRPAEHSIVADSDRECIDQPHDEAGSVTQGRSTREGACGGGWWASEPDVGRVVDGVPSWVDRLRVLGNAVVPYVGELVAWRVLTMIGEPTGKDNGGGDRA